MVSRSARIWQVWKSSDRALMTGTDEYSAISTSPAWDKVRQTLAETIRDITSAVSAMDSLCPSCASPGLMISGCPPSAAMPAANDTRVRVEVLSKMTAAVCGPASGDRE